MPHLHPPHPHPPLLLSVGGLHSFLHSGSMLDTAGSKKPHSPCPAGLNSNWGDSYLKTHTYTQKVMWQLYHLH